MQFNEIEFTNGAQYNNIKIESHNPNGMRDF